MKLSEFADITRSTIVSGPPDLDIIGVGSLETAREGDATFLASLKYAGLAAATQASAIILNEKDVIDRQDLAILRSKDPYLAFARGLRAFHPEPALIAFRHPTAVIDPSASVDESTEIHAGVAIGGDCRIAAGVRIFPNTTIYSGSRIGENTTVHSNVSIRENTEIGRNCIIHNNVSIGADGFGFAKDEERHWLKIPQTGRVVIEDDVEIGANSAVDRPTVGETRLKRGVKIDNLVQIGHACVIDEDALICAQTGLAGSSIVGKRVVLAGQVGVAGHLTIGDDVSVTGQSGVTKSIEPGRFVSGLPAIDNREWRRLSAAYHRLGDLVKTVRELEKRLAGSEGRKEKDPVDEATT